MTPEQLKAAQDKLAADQAELATREASFAEQQTALQADQAALAAREEATRAKELAQTNQANADFVEGLVQQGKVLPTEKTGIVAMMAALGQGAEIEFAEGDQVKKVNSLEYYKATLQARPKVIDFQERSGGQAGDPVDFNDGADFAKRVQAERKRVKDETGEDISFSDAATNLERKAAGK